ncbi:DUF6918 family protein [Allocoleopsis franciscana]|uniref:Uncharacterized protein n=1 Tax=Allocoleopsis franciscana PCC 7113 TaxID=1173027 RepID=K9WLD7_9CYAN|nr:hypothetical protein [Allocoleopsis franciscana]AFZ20357.1 hypothetical protein Mic7113_4684 [Allocoleopsis franciscana PCC 7113]
MGLTDGLNDSNKKDSLVADTVNLMDEHVNAKSGLGGMAWKAAYGTVKGVKPGYIEGAVERLLPECLVALDPMWSEGVQAGDPVQHLSQNSSRAADALLGITDARIEKTSNGMVRSAYKQLRGSAKNEVETAVPSLAKIIDKYTKS